MHIVTLAFVILSTYITAIQNLHFASITDFSEFLRKVGTRQKRKIGTFSLCFPLVGRCASCSSHVHILTKCALRLLAGDISIEKWSISLLASLQRFCAKQKKLVW